MTLSEAKENVGGLARIYFAPTKPDSKLQGVLLYVQILEADDSGITLITEDRRPDQPYWSLFRCVPGDGYTEALELVEPPRSRARIQRGE